ncbi:hypothetical protein [Nocardia sp. NPDC057227]|uniref:hypothetical protein n=1 Tax=Nocardia sp. NPDC057227 TaxID=3346056 RepID=UPI003627AECC
MSNPWVLVVVNVGALAFVILFAIRYGRRQERKAHARRIHPAAQTPAERDASLLFLRKEAGRPCEYGDATFSCSDFLGLWQQWCGPCLALGVLRDTFPESSPLRPTPDGGAS